MLARAMSAVLSGVEAIPVTAEVDIGSGLPAFTVVGLPDATVSQARDRVRGAITNSGLDYPMQRITANLAPSDVRKQGSGLDLVLALAILAANEQIPGAGLEPRMFPAPRRLDGRDGRRRLALDPSRRSDPRARECQVMSLELPR